ncbi:MAG: nucleotidyltransferase family protein [Dermabacter sp.]|nr:nucleotidyltransferase family protein [Dermabacter sp.]
MPTTPTAPPMATRLRITHALLETLGREAGIRVLHIKGVTLDADLAKNRHASTDCDVLVPPTDAERYCDALATHGWDLRTRFEHGSVFGHAATMYHPVWGTVDVHRSFPGLDTDADATFEAWWQDGREIELGGARLRVPSALDQRVLLLMHAARSPNALTSHDFRVTWEDASADERRALEARAVALGAITPLMILTDTGDGERIDRVRGEPTFHLWDAISRGANPTELWNAQIQDAHSWTQKIGIMWKAAHVNRDHLAIQLGHAPTRAEIAREWVHRLGRGTRRLRRLVRPRGGDTSAR